MIRVVVTIRGADETIRAFRDARRGIDKAVKLGLLEAARIAEPAARDEAPHRSGHLRSTIRAGSTTRSGYVEARGPYAGITIFGGVVRGTIRPASKRALALPFGARARVTSPRHYKANPFLARGVAKKRSEIEPALLDAVTKPYARYFEVTST